MRRPALILLGITALVTAGCTGETRPPSSESTAPCSPGPGCGLVVSSDGTDYTVECAAVPEALVDVELPSAEGAPPIRAIAGVASVQGVAVAWKDPGGCGLWVLGLATGIGQDAAASIRDEMGRGIERFGVTASPVPHDTQEG